MKTLGEAHAKAAKVVGDKAAAIGIDLAINENATRDEPWCWVFFYNSRAYLETGSFTHALTGNGPIVVEKATGVVHELVTARPVDDQLEDLRLACGS
jgi:Immunity protein 35